MSKPWLIANEALLKVSEQSFISDGSFFFKISSPGYVLVYLLTGAPAVNPGSRYPRGKDSQSLCSVVI